MTTPDTENARKLVASVRAAYDASTQGIWGLTTWAGGFNWGGKKTAYCGTNKDTGEPLKIPATEADNVFMAEAHNALPVILAHLASVERDLSDLRMREAALVTENARLRLLNESETTIEHDSFMRELLKIFNWSYDDTGELSALSAVKRLKDFAQRVSKMHPDGNPKFVINEARDLLAKLAEEKP